MMDQGSFRAGLRTFLQRILIHLVAGVKNCDYTPELSVFLLKLLQPEKFRFSDATRLLLSGIKDLH